jgi:lambda family phage portal protein
VAYWIQKSQRELGGFRTSVMAWSSKDYMRIPAKVGHRWNVLHGFITQDAEQYRGMPFFAPAMKFFRDLNDYLDAELVSNIVTAAFSMFVEVQTGSDPFNIGNSMLSMSGESVDTTNQVRYQELMPGQIMYGNTGEKPHPIAAARPGATFEPFTKVIKKAISMSLNIPYPVLFKDVETVNFAGFRSAMLDAWRVFMMRRTWLGQGLCQKVWTMLMEEAFLRGDLKIDNFYTTMHQVTRAEWRGTPKGDIEPIKRAEADIREIQNNLKTRAEAIAERGGDIRTTFDQLAEEQEMMAARGLTEVQIEAAPAADSDDNMVDDMAGAGEGLDISGE